MATNALALDHWGRRAIDDIAEECSRILRDPHRHPNLELLRHDLLEAAMSDTDVQGLEAFWAPGPKPEPTDLDSFLTGIVGEETMARFRQAAEDYIDKVLDRRGRLMEAALILTPADRWHLLVELDTEFDPFVNDQWTVACLLPHAVDEPESRWVVQQGRTMGCSYSVPLRAFAFPFISPPGG